MPTQFGKHFWPGFSFVSGIRIDYLSPTLYFTDILIFLLFVLFLLNSKKEIISKLFNWKVLLFALVLLVGIIFSKNQPAGLYGLLKFFEFFFFGFYISRKLKTIKDFETLTLVLSIGVIFESILAAFQFLNQRSLSGILYYLGERNFNGQTPGIANASISGKLILRPYGTFSHPNVLAGYLIIVSMIIISNFNPSTSLRTRFQISNAKKMFYIFSLVVSSIALFLTMGRVAIIAWLAIVIFMAFDYLKNRIKNISTIYYLLFVVLIFASLLLSPIGYRFTGLNLSDESVALREQLIDVSLSMIKNNPLLGVGVNNFLVNLPLYQNASGNIFYIQPVHNIFLLVFAETGILGLLFFLWFLFITFKQLQKKKISIFPFGFAQGGHFPFSIFFAILLIGLFDHYFLTLQQGQMLFSLVFGLAWSSLNKI